MTDESTPLRALKERVAAFVAARDWAQYHAPKNLAMAIACEAAELMELYLWVDAAGSRELTGEPAKRTRVEDEVADVAICLLNLCNVVGIDLAAAVEKKLADADAKYPPEKVRGRAEKYDEYESG
jgi:NTP pyrophosphatase (non-canonical NTP hydrolase)